MFQGIEWVLIGGVLLILMLVPKKIPEMARAIGRASREFKEARTELSEKMVDTGPNRQPPLVAEHRSATE